MIFSILQVHAFFSGTLSGVTTSTNDPLFILHHTMIDKLFERWLRMHRPHVSQVKMFSSKWHTSETNVRFNKNKIVLLCFCTDVFIHYSKFDRT